MAGTPRSKKMLHGYVMYDIIKNEIRNLPGMELIFKNVYPVNEVPDKIDDNSILIVNTNSSHPGHWVTFFVVDESYVIFFDSYGREPYYYKSTDKQGTNTIKSIAERYDACYIKWNQNCYQNDSESCGGYAVLFTLFILYKIRNSIFSSSLSRSLLKVDYLRYIDNILQDFLRFLDEIKEDADAITNKEYCDRWIGEYIVEKINDLSENSKQYFAEHGIAFNLLHLCLTLNYLLFGILSRTTVSLEVI